MRSTSAARVALPLLVTLFCSPAPLASSPPATVASTSHGAHHASPKAQNQGTGVGVWPLRGELDVTRVFEPPDVRWGRGHRGVDLAGSAAQSVVASLPGEVSFAGRVAGRPIVVVRHGDTRTTYEPVIPDVSVGEQVDGGGRLGWLHPAGSHCAPASCLHWGWLRGETYLDPLDLVGVTRVRLLPLWSVSPGATVSRDRPALLPRTTAPATTEPTAPRRGPWWPLMPWGGPVGRPS